MLKAGYGKLNVFLLFNASRLSFNIRLNTNQTDNNSMRYQQHRIF